MGVGKTRSGNGNGSGRLVSKTGIRKREVTCVHEILSVFIWHMHGFFSQLIVSACTLRGALANTNLKQFIFVMQPRFLIS